MSEVKIESKRLQDTFKLLNDFIKDNINIDYARMYCISPTIDRRVRCPDLSL